MTSGALWILFVLVIAAALAFDLGLKSHRNRQEAMAVGEAARWVATCMADANGQATWNLKTDGGDNVASGIYLYLVTDSQGNKAHGKFGVI